MRTEDASLLFLTLPAAAVADADDVILLRSESDSPRSEKSKLFRDSTLPPLGILIRSGRMTVSILLRGDSTRGVVTFGVVVVFAASKGMFSLLICCSTACKVINNFRYNKYKNLVS